MICAQVVRKRLIAIYQKDLQESGTVKIMNSMLKFEDEMFERSVDKKKVKCRENGKWKEFNRQAVLIAEGYYQDDQKHGLWKQYYETGELLIEEEYNHGILHGRYAAYHINGQLMSEGHYVNGSREDYFNVFDECGKQVMRMLFFNNSIVNDNEKKEIHLNK